MKFTRFLALFLAIVTLCGSFVGCNNEADPKDTGTKDTEPEEVDLADLDYKGATFTVHTSINVDAHESEATKSSNYLIQGAEEVVGDKASDSALQRNKKVEEDLNIRFQYVESDFAFNEVGSKVRDVIKAGVDEINLIINDSGCARLSAEGLLHDATYGKFFDFSQPYWYDGFMESSSLNSNTRYLLAGDYFIDVIRHSECLVMNKDLLSQMGGDPEAIYDLVRKGEWTLDALISIVNGGSESYNYMTGEVGYPYNGTYIDNQGNKKKDRRDQWGIVMWQWWGPMIPFITACDPDTFMVRDEDGYPVITVNNERTISLVEKLNTLFHTPSTAVQVHKDATDTVVSFTEGRILFLTNQKLGDLESELYANSEVNLAVLPYPKLDEFQTNYNTTSVSEVGFIPSTVSFANLDYVSAVVEYLNQISAETVIPKYYESTLKIRYARDSANADMIQLIHDNPGNIFPYIWDIPEGNNIFTHGIHDSVYHNDNTFSSYYKSYIGSAETELEQYISDYEFVKEALEAQYAGAGE
ncbi:MAG: hypothetical protein E7627_06640 [Ruminococcaceae bacterium]|nr:hypothetical protein [Oscillospiraceae bacterium]